MVDSVAHVERAEAVAQQHGVRLPLCLDMDMSMDFPGLHFGVWRSPLRTADRRARSSNASPIPTLRLDGIMGYEAQIAGVGDILPGKALKNALVRHLKRRSVGEAARAAPPGRPDRSPRHLAALRQRRRHRQHATTREEAGVTEITVGSGFLLPRALRPLSRFPLPPAAGIAIEIVRQPRPASTPAWVAATSPPAQPGPKAARPYLPVGARLCRSRVQARCRRRSTTTDRAARPGRPDLPAPCQGRRICEHFTHLLLVSDGAWWMRRHLSRRRTNLSL